MSSQIFKMFCKKRSMERKHHQACFCKGEQEKKRQELKQNKTKNMEMKLQFL